MLTTQINAVVKVYRRIQVNVFGDFGPHAWDVLLFATHFEIVNIGR